MAVWLFLKMGAEQAPLNNQEWPFTRILLAQHFPGWTLDYIDRLSQKDVNNIFAVLNAQDDARHDKGEEVH